MLFDKGLFDIYDNKYEALKIVFVSQQKTKGELKSHENKWSLFRSLTWFPVLVLNIKLHRL